MFGALNAYNNAKKRLDDRMVDSFFEAADERPKARPQNREEIIALVTASNTYRWWRLRHDYKWLQKQMKKNGYNPDDARELL